MRKVGDQIVRDDNARNIWGEYVFTEEEIRQMSKDLASKNIELIRIESAKKAVTADFKSKSELTQKEIDCLSSNISSGSTYKDIRCYVEYNFKDKTKSYYNVETDVLVKTSNLDAEDFQMKMNFEDEEKKAASFDKTLSPITGDMEEAEIKQAAYDKLEEINEKYEEKMDTEPEEDIEEDIIVD